MSPGPFDLPNGQPTDLDVLGTHIRAERQKLLRLVPQALAGDQAALAELKAFLPCDGHACFPFGRRPEEPWPYTQACLGRDLAKAGKLSQGRDLLIGAWSHDHYATLMSLDGLIETIRAFRLVRPADPHLASLTFPLTLYRGQSRQDAGSGLSWTTDPDKARWFVETYWPARTAKACEDPVVIERKLVNASDVLAVVGPDEGRYGEDEIILYPPELS